MIEHFTANIFLDVNGIVWFKFKEHADITLTHAYEYVTIIDKLCGEIPRFFILDTRNTYASVSPECRKFMGNNSDALKWRKADAVLVNSLPLRMLANFYIKFDTPNHPVRLFNEEEKALDWFTNFKIDKTL